MATADIAKEAIFDPRVVQHSARYAVQKGALSLTNAPFNAISSTTSQHTYQINVPSQTVFCDRALQWTSTVRVGFTVTVAGTNFPAGNANNRNVPVAVYGRDFALQAFPLNSLIGTTTATINDTSVTINTESVFNELLRLTDYKKNRISRTCPTKLDTIASYDSAPNSVVSPLASFENQTEYAEQPNGAYYRWKWIDPNTGAELGAGPGTYQFPPGGTAVNFVSGMPTLRDGGAAPQANTNGAYPVAIEFTSTEKLLLSPFIFADAAEWETGLFGVNNIQIVLNLKSSIPRLLRNCTNASGVGVTRTISNTAFANVGTNGAFPLARINVQFLTPSLDLPLPSKSVCQYLEFPRYLQSYAAGAVAAGALIETQSSQNIVLPQIPDALLIYVKPTNNVDPKLADFYYPIERISVNFDNYAGLLSSHTAEQLYEMSVHNGLDMDWNSWSGAASRVSGLPTAPQAGAPARKDLQAVGGFLVLKPGQDITLSAGQAPGLIGNFTLQFNYQWRNTSDAALVPGPGGTDGVTLTVVAVNSGFFETLAGSSRIVKGVLSEADILSAEPAPEMTHTGLERLVGHGFMDKLGSMLSKAKSIYSAAQPVLSAVKGALPEEGKMGAVRSAMGAVGLGRGGPAGGAGGPAGGRKSLTARLM